MEPEDYTILLVEDDPDDVILIQRAFKKAKIANPLQVVTDGKEAVAYLKGQGIYTDRKQYPLPILILLDLKMPKMSGFEVLEWFRKQSVLNRIIVVVLTSSGQTTDINRAYDLGANSYLVKPVGFEGLIKMVHTLQLYWLIINEKPSLE